jgi:hypothetical protein
METDFSRINLTYLIGARDLARAAPARAPVMLGVPEPLVALLTAVTPETLARVGDIRTPLIVPRQALWWWERLLTALNEERPEAVQDILDHARLLLVGE